MPAASVKISAVSKVTSYRNTERHCFCHIRFSSGERILVSVAGVPWHGIRVMKLLFGIIPFRTIWEYNVRATEQEAAYRELIDLFTGQTGEKADHPLDAVILRLLNCRSCYEAADMLQCAVQEISHKADASVQQQSSGL